ncbi:MAG TPA: hypothetical protein DD491_05555 [Halieaceae bacterium]|nr:hypothetical protein [Halieaceae bacterium]
MQLPDELLFPEHLAFEAGTVIETESGSLTFDLKVVRQLLSFNGLPASAATDLSACQLACLFYRWYCMQLEQGAPRHRVMDKHLDHISTLAVYALAGMEDGYLALTSGHA